MISINAIIWLYDLWSLTISSVTSQISVEYLPCYPDCEFQAPDCKFPRQPRPPEPALRRKFSVTSRMGPMHLSLHWSEQGGEWRSRGGGQKRAIPCQQGFYLILRWCVAFLSPSPSLPLCPVGREAFTANSYLSICPAKPSQPSLSPFLQSTRMLETTTSPRVWAGAIPS